MCTTLLSSGGTSQTQFPVYGAYSFIATMIITIAIIIRRMASIYKIHRHVPGPGLCALHTGPYKILTIFL